MHATFAINPFFVQNDQNVYPMPSLTTLITNLSCDAKKALSNLKCTKTLNMAKQLYLALRLKDVALTKYRKYIKIECPRSNILFDIYFHICFACHIFQNIGQTFCHTVFL